MTEDEMRRLRIDGKTRVLLSEERYTQADDESFGLLDRKFETEGHPEGFVLVMTTHDTVSRVLFRRRAAEA